MPTLAAPPAAAEHHAESAIWAAEAAKAAQKAKPNGPRAVAGAVRRYQAGAALRGQTAVATILDQQQIDVAAEAFLNSLGFTTDTNALVAMIDATADAEFNRLVESLVQDAARAAESVSVAARPEVRFVRYLTLPSCARCTVLAGRIYRYSQGFLRHPNCDCVMLPTTVAAPGLVQDPAELAKAGQVRGLSRADLLAVEQGADFGRVVNVRSRKAGLRQAGRVLSRRGRPTPEGIYAIAGDDRAAALRLLKLHNYLL